MNKKIITAMSLAIAMVMMVTPAMAATTSFSTEITPSIQGSPATMSVSSSQSSSTVITPIVEWVNGEPVVSTSNTSIPANVEITILDDSGTQDGWRLQVTSTPLTEVVPAGGFESGDSPIVLPSGLISFANAPTIVNGDVGTTGITSDYTGQPIDVSTVTLASADEYAGAGMTTVSVDGFQFNDDDLSFLASSEVTDSKYYPDQPTPYSTTITWSLVSAP